MCGIIGIISTNGNVSRMLRESLKRLEYRGYDSAGIATIANGIIFVKKDKGKIDEIHRMLNFDSLPGNIGIGHTRWATHGQPSRENAHPHLDCSGMIAVVHNGIIENYLELREELSKLGHTFRSETDTEVIPHLIEEFLKSNKSLEEAVRQALLKVKGSFAIAVISSKEPDKIICARKESPLLIGIGNSQMFCASDIPAILPYTRNIIVLDDMEMAVLTPNSVTIRRIDTGEIVNKDIIQVSWSPEEAEKGGFPHFMLKEIHEQPRAIRDTLRVDEKALEIFVQKILTADKIYFVAAGTSYHAALAAKYMLAKLAGLGSDAIIASEFEEQFPGDSSGDSVLIAISQSGETADTLVASRIAKNAGVCVLAIVNVVGSSLTRLADHVLYTRAGPEIGVAATKTFTTQLTLLSMIAAKAARENGMIDLDEYIRLNTELNEMPRKVRDVIERIEIKVKQLSKHLANCRNAFYLGRGISTATALEGALKMKEIAYIHAEGYPAGESKHGPIALVEPGFPCIFVAPPDSTYHSIIGNVTEMKARGAEIIVLTSKSCDDVIKNANTALILPEVHPILSPIPYIVPLQLLAYYTAVERGYDPDRPRNLAKSVTVQ